MLSTRHKRTKRSLQHGQKKRLVFSTRWAIKGRLVPTMETQHTRSTPHPTHPVGTSNSWVQVCGAVLEG